MTRYRLERILSARSLLAATAAFWVGLIVLSLHAAAAASNLEQAYGARAGVILQSAEAMLKRPVKPDQSSGSIAHRCLSAVRLVPILGERALGAVRQAADALVATAADEVNGAGWSFRDEDKTEKACGGPGSLDAFRDGSCNPGGTRYTYQTSLALTCVAKAYALTRATKYLATSQAVVNASWPHGGPVPSCNNCFSYWYSYHPNDADRYVRNVNTLMGMALGAVYEVTGEARIRERLEQIANAEHQELAAENFGYLSIADPKFRANPGRERVRIENHAPFVAHGLRSLGASIGSATALGDAKAIMASWLDCPGGDCAKRPCSFWAGDPARCTTTAAAAPCLFRALEPKFTDACRTFMDRATSLNATQLWMVLNDVK